jgi:hypothetical protein
MNRKLFTRQNLRMFGMVYLVTGTVVATGFLAYEVVNGRDPSAEFQKSLDDASLIGKRKVVQVKEVKVKGKETE